MIKKMYDWMGTKVHSPHAPFFLASLSLLESLILPPVAPILVLFCLEKRKNAFFYAAIVTIFSVIGGVIAYYIGYALWETVGQRLVLYLTTQEKFEKLLRQFDQYEALAVIIGSFSPVPYRLLSIAAGFFQIALFPFIAYSLVGRGTRYFLVALTFYLWGAQLKIFIDRWFNQLVLLFFVIMVLGFLILLKT